jgi:hypothetical protein
MIKLADGLAFEMIVVEHLRTALRSLKIILMWAY